MRISDWSSVVCSSDLFAGPVPTELVKALGKTPGTWSAVFGPIAEQAFNSWYTARYVDAIAAAGKAVKPLPMYTNASLSDPFVEPRPTGVQRSEEHTSELQSLMRISYAVFCLTKKKHPT